MKTQFSQTAWIVLSMTGLIWYWNVIIRTIVLQVSAITFRKGNTISRDRTLRFLLVCKVIGSPSRSRFAREFNILQVRAEHYPVRDTIPQLQDAGILHPGRCRLPSYRIFTYRFRYRLAFPSPRTIFRLDLYTGVVRRGNEQANDLETVMHTHREILVPMAELSKERAGR